MRNSQRIAGAVLVAALVVAAGVLLLPELRSSTDRDVVGVATEESRTAEVVPRPELLEARGRPRVATGAPPADGWPTEEGPGVVLALVVDEAGEPIPDVELVLHGRAEKPPRPTSTTDARGMARWERVVSPRVDIYVARDDPMQTPVGGQGTPGGPPVRLVWMRFTEVTLQCVDEAGNAVRRARLSFESDELRHWRREHPHHGWPRRRKFLLFFEETDVEGRVSFLVPAPPPRGTLTIDPWDTALAIEVRDGWAPTSGDLRLSRAHSVAGVVRDPEGNPYAEGSVLWRTDAGREGEARVQWDGTFDITRISAGTVRLEFHHPDIPGLAGQNVLPVAAGSEGVVLSVRLGASLDLRIADWPRRPGGVAWLLPEGPQDARAKPVRADVDVEGRASFRGLEQEGSYRLYVPCLVDGQHVTTEAGGEWRIVDRTGVRASSEPLEVGLVAGRTAVVEVDLTSPGSPGPHSARTDKFPWWAGEGQVTFASGVRMYAQAEELAAGARAVTLRFRGVPTGSWPVDTRVWASGRRAGESYQGHAAGTLPADGSTLRLSPTKYEGLKPW